MKPYYEDALVTLYHGDCFDVLPHLAVRADVITDPPYSIPTQVAAGRENTRNVGDLSMVERSFRSFFDMTLRLTGDAGRHFVFGDGTSYPVVFRAMYGRAVTALLVWDKGQIGMGREFRKSHELIMHAWGASTPVVSDGTGYPDVIRCAPVPSAARVHPAEKPVPLLSALLRVCGDTVLDPFAGSGASLVASKLSGRKAIGIEIEERYCEAAARRLSSEAEQRNLFSGEAA
jgi:site-specific DNA-methyltransferase (adenine-specific)